MKRARDFLILGGILLAAAALVKFGIAPLNELLPAVLLLAGLAGIGAGSWLLRHPAELHKGGEV